MKIIIIIFSIIGIINLKYNLYLWIWFFELKYNILNTKKLTTRIHTLRAHLTCACVHNHMCRHIYVSYNVINNIVLSVKFPVRPCHGKRFLLHRPFELSNIKHFRCSTNHSASPRLAAPLRYSPSHVCRLFIHRIYTYEQPTASQLFCTYECTRMYKQNVNSIVRQPN